MTSRGCPFNCDYCASRHLWRNYERRRAGDIIAEIMVLDTMMEETNLAFYDDALLHDAPAHIIPVLEGLVT